MLSYEDFRLAIAIGEAGSNLEKEIEENKKLCERYPFLIPINEWTGKPLDRYDYQYTYLDDMPIGWKRAFGIDLCEDLRNILVKADFLDKYQVVQVKEKFGALRWYDNGVPNEIWDEYRDWLNKYETLSENTCINCGKPGKMRTVGWISPWCDECWDNHVKKEV